LKTSIKTIGLLAALAMALTGPLFSQVPDLTKGMQPVDRKLAAKEAVELTDWKDLIDNYIEAHNLAIDKVASS